MVETYFNLNYPHKPFEPENFRLFQSFLTESGLKYFRAKAEKWLEEAGIRRDFRMKQSNDTPRHMRVVPGTILNQDPEIVALYKDQKLLQFLKEITEQPVTTYHDELDNMVVTALEGPGDTHGEHLDTPPLALIMCLESPGYSSPADTSGALQFKNHQNRNQIERIGRGDAYLLRTDLMPHQVLPLTIEGTRRIILNFTYGIEGIENEADGSAEALFT